MRVLDHRRIAAQHHVRVRRGQRDPRPGFETAAADGVGDAPRQCAGMRFAAHHRKVGERARMIGATVKKMDLYGCSGKAWGL